MGEKKRRSWISRLFGASKDAPEPAQHPMPVTAGGGALNALFGTPDSATTSAKGEMAANSVAEPLADVALIQIEDMPFVVSAPPAALVTGNIMTVQPAINILRPLQVPEASAAEQLGIMVHVSNRGDVLAGLEDWAGERGSGLAIEGVAVTAIQGIDPDDLGYRVMLNDGTVTKWYQNNTFCGTRGEARPILAFAMRITGDSASKYRISYAAVFVDGSEVGPVHDGELCAAVTKMPVEAIYVMVDVAH